MAPGRRSGIGGRSARVRRAVRRPDAWTRAMVALPLGALVATFVRWATLPYGGLATALFWVAWVAAFAQLVRRRTLAGLVGSGLRLAAAGALLVVAAGLLPAQSGTASTAIPGRTEPWAVAGLLAAAIVAGGLGTLLRRRAPGRMNKG